MPRPLTTALLLVCLSCGLVGPVMAEPQHATPLQVKNASTERPALHKAPKQAKAQPLTRASGKSPIVPVAAAAGAATSIANSPGTTTDAGSTGNLSAPARRPGDSASAWQAPLAAAALMLVIALKRQGGRS